MRKQHQPPFERRVRTSMRDVGDLTARVRGLGDSSFTAHRGIEIAEGSLGSGKIDNVKFRTDSLADLTDSNLQRNEANTG